MAMPTIRPAAVAGSWYPGTARALAAEVDRYLGAVRALPVGEVVALVVPHAGIMYSGPVAAYAYKLVEGRTYDVVVLIGPSHHVGFTGVAVDLRDGWATPLGTVPIDGATADALAAASPVVRDLAVPHQREHSLEMQLPFLRRVLPEAPIVPLVMGLQDRDTILDLAHALASVLAGKRALIVASSDLSHYQPARVAAELDGRVIRLIERFDVEGLLGAIEGVHEHACGGGPIAAAMWASRELGAVDGRVLTYGDSGDITGDKGAVVGYLAAAFGTFPADHARGAH
jgi:AmmeMemoRadiSam system protein B